MPAYRLSAVEWTELGRIILSGVTFAYEYLYVFLILNVVDIGTMYTGRCKEIGINIKYITMCVCK